MLAIADGVFRDVEWNRYNHDGSVSRIKGLYLMSDNGYIKRPWTVCPIKRPEGDKAKFFTECAEAGRKSIECLFTMKNVFACLTNVRCHSLEAADDLFFVCCTLHNYILNKDGMDVVYTAAPYTHPQVGLMEGRAADARHGIFGDGDAMADDDDGDAMHGDDDDDGHQVEGAAGAENHDRTTCTHTCTYAEFLDKLVDHHAHWAKNVGTTWSVSPLATQNSELLNRRNED
jgi:hypothetical protein